jgi:DNA-binding response OmpR family regulator
MYTVLVCDDDKDIVSALKIYLSAEGYRVLTAHSGGEALAALDENEVHLVLLDIMMPGMDGITALSKLREKHNVPVIFITAKSEDNDVILGLNLGADDYIAKPFRPRELVSRMKSVLRRAGKIRSVVELGSVRVDIDKANVTKNGVDLCLSALEYRLLLTFINNRGIALTRAQLLEHIWDAAGDFVNDNTLTVYIKRLRDKLEDDPQEPTLIKTVRGVGYKLD